MLTRSRGLVALTAVASALLTAPASATIVTITWEGTLSPDPLVSFDATGEFGPPGWAIAGAPYLLVFTFDTTRGTVFTDGVTGVQLDSGPGEPSAGSAVLTINGRSQSFLGTLAAQHLIFNDGSRFEFGQLITDELVDGDLVNNNLVAAFDFGRPSERPAYVLSLTTPLSRDLPPLDPNGLLAAWRIETRQGAGNTFLREAQGAFIPSRLTVTSGDIPPIPAPATLPLLATGVATFAALLNHRRRAARRPPPP
jgi:hypothetical protein